MRISVRITGNKLKGRIGRMTNNMVVYTASHQKFKERWPTPGECTTLLKNANSTSLLGQSGLLERKEEEKEENISAVIHFT